MEKFLYHFWKSFYATKMDEIFPLNKNSTLKVEKVEFSIIDFNS